MSTDDFQTKYAAVMETMLQSAIAETTKIFESMVDELKAEISRVRKENEDLKLKCSQFETSRSLSNFSSEDSRLLPGRRDRSGKRDTAVQCDLVAASTIPTEQCQPLRMLPVYPSHHNTVAALQDHDYETHVEDSSQITIIMTKQESALKQEEDESVVGSGQFLNDYTEIPLYLRHEEPQMAVELPALGMCSNPQGSPDQTLDPSTHSLATSTAAVNCYTGDYSKVSQKISVAASHGTFMVPESHQLAVAQVKPVEEEQQAESQPQSVLIPRNSHTDQHFSINMEKDTLEASSTPVRINTLPAEPPHAPSVQPKECHNSPLQFTSSSQEPCFAMDPEITVHEVPRIFSQINDDTSGNGAPPKHTSSFPVTVTVHSQTFTSFNKSVGLAIAQKQSCKDKLSAVVRLTRLPFPISEEESVLVSRLPTSACCDCRSFFKSCPSKEMSSAATSTRPLQMSHIYSSLEESPFAVPLNNSQVPAEQNCIEEKLNVCTENFVTLDIGPKNEYWEDSAPSTLISTVAFNRMEVSPCEPTSNSREEKISDALPDCAMTNDRSEEEIQSATLVKVNPIASEDTSDPHVLMSKSQFLAQLAVSPVAQGPEKAPSIDSVDAIASGAETGRSEKKRLQQHSPLAQLQSHIKKHLQARRAKRIPQMETQAASYELPSLENDQLIDESTILKLRGVEDITSLQTDDSTAINPTISVSCQKGTVSESSHIVFSKSKAIIESASVRHRGLCSDGDGQDSLNMSSVSVSPRRPGLPTESATLKKTRNESVGYRITRSNRNNAKPKNTPFGGRNAAALMSMNKSKLIQDVSKKHFEMVTANTNTVTKSKTCNRSKLQNRAKRRQFGENEPCGKALKQCASQTVWTLDISRSQATSTRIRKSAQLSVGKEAGSQDSQVVFTPSVSLKPIPVKAPPIVSPLQPLLVIGRRLLKNQCGECGQVLSSSAALESHVSLHTGHRPFSCSLCGKHFADSKSLKRHNRVHRNGRIHVCQQCGKGFVYRFCLTKHIQMVHSRIKPFVCQICNKGCFTKLDVEAHIRMHTGEKPFHCNLCDKKFKRRVNLNVHLRWHNGEKRHWCPYCGKGFLDFNNLKRHKYIHTGEKPHSCPHCPKHFTQSGHLKKHVKNVHKVK